MISLLRRLSRPLPRLVVMEEQPKATIATWQEEKKRLAELSDAEWASRRDAADAVNVEDLPSFSKEFVEENDFELLNKEIRERFLAKRPDLSVASNKSELASKVSLHKGDITRLAVDAIVNAANSSLLGGGGVDGAIHKAAGKLLFEECKTLNGCDTGDAKISAAYDLPAKHIIHTVGPMGKNPEKLTESYESCFNVMLEHKLRTIAFPCISTGVYGYPNFSACRVALNTTSKFLQKHADEVDKIVFCVFLEKDWEIYMSTMQLFFTEP